MEVRRIGEEEAEEAGRVTALAYREFVRPEDSGWQEYLERIADVASRAGRTVVLGAFEAGRCLGTLTLELTGRVDDHEDEVPLDPDEAHVRMLGVHPEARGRGVARALMSAAAEEARRAGKRVITLNTARRMKAAQAMYERLGFTRGPDVPHGDSSFLAYSLRLDGSEG